MTYGIAVWLWHNCRHISSLILQDEAIAKYEKVRLASTNRLFQYAMIIGLCDDGNGNNTPKIAFCFPKDVSKLMHALNPVNFFGIARVSVVLFGKVRHFSW